MKKYGKYILIIAAIIAGIYVAKNFSSKKEGANNNNNSNGSNESNDSSIYDKPTRGEGEMTQKDGTSDYLPSSYSTSGGSGRGTTTTGQTGGRYS